MCCRSRDRISPVFLLLLFFSLSLFHSSTRSKPGTFFLIHFTKDASGRETPNIFLTEKKKEIVSSSSPGRKFTEIIYLPSARDFTFKDCILHYSPEATAEERQRFQQSSDRDWTKFLLLRARELKQGKVVDLQIR